MGKIQMNIQVSLFIIVLGRIRIGGYSYGYDFC